MSLIGDMLSTGSDQVWKALSDPTRRKILESLSARSTTTGNIVDQFSSQLARTAVMKHLDVLESAHLIRVERVGRTRVNHFQRRPLNQIAEWLARHVNEHHENLNRLKHLSESTQRRRRNTPS